MDMKNSAMELEQYTNNALIKQFLKSVAAYKDECAIDEGNIRISYQELDELSDSIANNLQEHGVNASSHIALCLPRSINLTACIIAIAKIGACSIPVDPEAPKSRQNKILNQSNATYAIGLSGINQTIHHLSIVELIKFRATRELTLGKAAVTRFSILYTSGSTGVPKGVPITQKAILNLVMDPGYVSIPARSRIAHWANPTFDAQLFEIWGALLNGACLMIFHQNEVLNTDSFAQKILSSSLDYAFMTASLFNFMVKNHPGSVISIKHLLVGGEALSPVTSQRYYQLQTCSNSPKSQLYNAYGPTECTTFSLCHKVDESRLAQYIDKGRVPIGSCIGNTNAIIVDKQNQLTAIGEIGELYLTGPSLAEGYYQDEQKTARAFITREHKNTPHIWYKTGDLVLLNDRQEIEYIGRLDDQIKVRGHRVETSEIEITLLNHPSISQAAIIPVTQASGVKDIYAFIVGSQDKSVEVIRDYLSQTLPSYMLPHKIIARKALPLTANGKLDKALLVKKAASKGLKTITSKTLIDKISQLAPIRGLVVADLLKHHLSNNLFLLEQSFLDAGGDSLKAMTLIADIKKETGIAVSVGKLLNTEKLSEFFTYIEKLESIAYQKPNNTNQEYYPASKEQTRLYFLQQLDPKSTAYYAPFIFYLDNEIDTNKLETAWQKVISRHPLLKSQFSLSDGELHVLINPKLNLSIKYHTVFAHELQKKIQEISKHTFNLNEGPLAQSALVKVHGQSTQVLVLSFHHIVIDGWSINILLRDLSNFYENKLIYDDLSEKSLLAKSYSDFCYQSNLDNRSIAYTNSESYWREKLSRLADARPLFNPLTSQHLHGKQIKGKIARPVWQQIQQILKEEGITLFSYLLSQYYLALTDFFDNDSIPIGSPVANRHDADYENLVGLLVNTTVFHLNKANSHDSYNWLKHVQQEVSKTLDNQLLDYQDLITLRPLTNRNTPLFECLLILENTDLNNLVLEGNVANSETGFLGDAKFPISLYITESKGEAELCLEFQLNCLNEEKANELLSKIQTRLGTSLPPKTSEHSVAESLKTTPYQWSDKSDQSRHPLHFIDRFEQQVSLNPNATACLWHEEKTLFTITYDDLNKRTNQLAHHLINTGVQANDIIGLSCAWSINTCVAILAIAKVGATYLPLDPRSPHKRLLSMLNSSQSSFVIEENTHRHEWGEETKVVCIDSEVVKAELNHLPNYNPRREPSEQERNSLAFVIYSSGSTGEPKGVMVNQSNIANLLTALEEMLSIKPQDRFLSITAPSFDIHVTELYLPLVTGASTLILDWEEVHTPSKLLKQQDDFNISVMQATPATWQLLVDQGWKPKQSLTMITGGDALSMNLKNALLANNARLFNLYGPSETAVYCAGTEIKLSDNKVHIGYPILNNRMYILNEDKQPVEPGEVGELYIAGANVGEGYLNNSRLTHEKFTLDPFIGELSSWQKMYQSGDLAKQRKDGAIELIGRIDNQIKLNGFRIEAGDIEHALVKHDSVQQALICCHPSATAGDRLVAYVVSQRDDDKLVLELTDYVKSQLPSYMVPYLIMVLSSFELNLNGKIDRQKLPDPIWLHDPAFKGDDYDAHTCQDDLNATKALLAQIIQKILGYPIGADSHFFEAGLNSILLMKVHHLITLNQGINLPNLSMMSLFDAPSISQLAKLIIREKNGALTKQHDPIKSQDLNPTNDDIAVIGMAVNLPSASNLVEFWDLLKHGKCSIKPVDQPTSEANNWVNVVSSIDNLFEFDTAYFGISEKYARAMDPQQRHALMTAVNALEDARIELDSENKVGVVLSAGESPMQHSSPNTFANEGTDSFHFSVLNDKDFLATRVAYHLNLKGPAYSVQTACSSSLVAIHQACQQIRTGESDVCLAGGANIDMSILSGYPYKEGMILSKSGLCRPFSDLADGTVPANGVAIVVLKSLKQAILDQDRIYATIKGSAINNDGKDKVSYFAPSISGQVDVVTEAIKHADINTVDIQYIEAHGTGTPLGDPIEIEALNQVYTQHAQANNAAGHRYLGSLKSQMGHLGAAAGISGFIKTALGLYFQKVPASLWASTINPEIDLDRSNFKIANSLQNWDKARPLAAVSSFGIGGTNAHVILEKAPSESKPSDLTVPSNKFDLKAFSPRASIGPSSLINEKNERNISDEFEQLPQDQWLMHEHWIREKRLKQNSHISPNRYILIDNREKQGEPLLHKLKASHTVDYYSSLDHFSLKLSQSHQTLQLDSVGSLVIIHFSSCANDTDKKDALSQSHIYQDWCELADFFKNWAELNIKKPLHFIHLQQGGADVLGDEVLQAEKALMLGFAQTLPHEFDHVLYSVLDIPLTLTLESLKVAIESIAEKEQGHLAIRADHLWKKSYQRLNPTQQEMSSRFDQMNKDKQAILDKVYVVTGGSGGIGASIIYELLNNHNAKVISLARSHINTEIDVNSSFNQIKCDITDFNLLADISRAIYESFGHISAVIHVAGMQGSGAMRLVDKDKALAHMSVKVQGAINIEKTLLKLKPRLVMYFSSMSAVYGVKGQTDYCSANHFLDLHAKALNHQDNGTEFISVNWPTWDKVGMAKDVMTSGFSIDKSQGIKQFNHLLNAAEGHYLVSPLADSDTKTLFQQHNQKHKTNNPLSDKSSLEFIESEFKTRGENQEIPL